MENEQVKVISLQSIKVSFAIKFIALLGVAVLAPLAQNQIVTGTIVNAVLLAAVFILGFKGAVAIAFFPSVISLGLGLLPGVMAPMVPFIIIGNLIFVSVFVAVKNKNYWLSAAGASVLKFVWLFATSQLVIALFIQKPIAVKIAAMMSWPQLLTALLASIVVYFIFFRTSVKSK